MKVWGIFLIILVLLLVAWLSYSHTLSWANIVEYERTLRDWVQKHWYWAMLIGWLVYTTTSLIPGTTGKAIVFGWLFGFLPAMLIVSLSLTLAAVISMTTVRFFFRDWAVRHVDRLIRRIELALERGGEATCLLMLRVLHVPYSLTNYAAGATRVRIRTFAWTTLVGMLPTNVVFVLAGSRLLTLDRLAEGDVWTFIEWRILFAASLVVIVPIGMRQLARLFMQNTPITGDELA